MPRFSIVVVYYQGTQSREVLRRGMASLAAQTFRDFEVLVYHDGPLTDPEAQADCPWPIRCTERRFNDWGHSLRDRGIREAAGDYVLFFNADNILYPRCLEALDAESRRPSRLFADRAGNLTNNPAARASAIDTDNILIYPILYHDLGRFMSAWIRLPTGSGARMIMTGNPPFFGLIDCMQLVMKRELWLSVGGWFDKSEASDGVIYPAACQKFGYRCLDDILGEHW